MSADPLLSIRGLTKVYTQRRWLAPEPVPTPALHNVTLNLGRGRTLGLVGPSGSGKSTLARCLAMMEAPSSGEIRFCGRNLWNLNRRDRASVRVEIQLILQEPAASLNPRFSAEQVIAEPLRIQKCGARKARRERVLELMEIVGLPRQSAPKSSLEFSGGERQRLAIARALALGPKLLILDESLSGLDLSVQAQITNLLLDLQERNGLTYVLISHDLTLVRHIADEIAVMDRGHIVEHAGTFELLAKPRHPRTRALLDSSLALEPGGYSG